jgi:hypothetical protein
MHRTRNAAYGQPYRGFESLPLRHLYQKYHRFFGLISYQPPTRTPMMLVIIDKDPSRSFVIAIDATTAIHSTAELPGCGLQFPCCNGGFFYIPNRFRAHTRFRILTAAQPL